MNPLTISAPILVLVRPEIPENLGFIARTLHCFGLDQWRIVGSEHLSLTPGSPAFKTASGAEAVFDKCERSASLADAVSDCHEVWGFSRRAHLSAPIELLSPALAAGLNDFKSRKVAWVFGPESQGLNSADAHFIQRWIRIETVHPTMSLNVSHAIAMAFYAWQSQIQGQSEMSPSNQGRVSSHSDEQTVMANRELFEKGWQILESTIHERQIFPANKEVAQLQHLRALWNRMELNQGEAEFLLGTFKVLLQGRQPRKSASAAFPLG